MGIITQEGLPENCDSAYIFIYICASFLTCLSSSLPGEEEDQSLAMLMMNVPAKLFVLACLFVIISARGRPVGPQPCSGDGGIAGCHCKDEAYYDGEDAVKKKCGGRTKNDIVSCSCMRGGDWNAPVGPQPCSGDGGIAGCHCKDKAYYDGEDAVKKNCGGRKKNDIVSCSCMRGGEWKPVKKNPCDSVRNVEACICADGYTYEGRRVMMGCKHDENPAKSCECKDGSQWPGEY